MNTTTATIVPEPQGTPVAESKDNNPGDGFVHLSPRTHDISFSGQHIPNITRLVGDLENAIKAGWPQRHDTRYSKVEVLLLSWEEDDLEVEKELQALRHVFEDLYHYGVQSYKIPNEKPDKALKRRVFDFLDYDGEEVLLILYYAGHAKTSLQSNEAPMWFANRKPRSPSLPSGGIQSMFEEADADVVLLYDCCNSAATTASSSFRGNKGVTEAISACGYETSAPEVGEHSFSNALTEILAATCKGPPFSIAELHSRVLNRLKCWAPCLVKDGDGKFKQDHAGRLQIECQPRRTPIYSILCESEPRRSILLSPLRQSNHSSATPETSSESHLLFEGSRRRGKQPLQKGIECPQILLTVRLEEDALDVQSWKEFLRQLPVEGKDIKIEGLYRSFSTLLLLRLPVTIWDLLPDHPAYGFVGFISGENVAVRDQLFLPLPSETIYSEDATVMDLLSLPAREKSQAAYHAPDKELDIFEQQKPEVPKECNSPLEAILEEGADKPTEQWIVPTMSQMLSNMGITIPLRPFPSIISLFRETLSATSSLKRCEIAPKVLNFSSPEPPSPSIQESMEDEAIRDEGGTQSLLSIAKTSTDDFGTSSPPDDHEYGQSHPRLSETGKSKKNSKNGYKIIRYDYYWIWGCCQCGRSAGMSTETEQCPELDCGHTRCGSCHMEEVKLPVHH